MVDLTDAQFEAAASRGAKPGEPQAASVHFDGSRIVIELTSGCMFAFPPRIAEGLESATDAQIGKVELLGQGFGLHWEELDVDLSVGGLLAGAFGTRAYLARRAGATTSAKKSAAARDNGRQGGRPRTSRRTAAT